MAEYIRIGEPANDAEREGFRLLRDLLPEHYLVLGNFDLRLPTRRTSLEFDAVVIGEYGFYAVEIKGWTGAIRGDARDWYLPWGRVSNPLNHLEKKTKALAQYVRSRVEELPEGIFYAPALFFPRPNTLLEIPAEIRRSVVQFDGVYEFFVNMEMVHERGPGPFRSREQSQKVVDAIIELAEPSEVGMDLPFYDVELEVDARGRRYREFLGAHKYLKSRSRVRIKAYMMDSLASPQQARQEQNRILRDMEALGVLEGNPYVARSYEMQPDYKDDLIFYLVSEWVGHRTLATLIDEAASQEGPVPGWRELSSHLVEALDSIHQRGIVHRNLSPGVIYLTGADARVPLKIADFDYARVHEMETIADGFTRLGTDGFMAPELWLEQPYDHRVDLFSLGAILFAMLTGRMLFEAPGDILYVQRAWRERRGWLDNVEMREIVGGLVAEDPARRSEAMEQARQYF